MNDYPTCTGAGCQSGQFPENCDCSLRLLEQEPSEAIEMDYSEKAYVWALLAVIFFVAAVICGHSAKWWA